MRKMPKTRPVPKAFRSGRFGYHDAEPDVMETGIGKNYEGYRIFFSQKTQAIDYIGDNHDERPANPEEVDRFKKDLAAAAIANEGVRMYIEVHPVLRVYEAEPQVEGPMYEAKGASS